MPKADKKARLIELLRESLANDATKINDKKHAPKIDVRLEREIKRLASEFSK